MAKRVAMFEKVSFEQFKEGFEDCFGVSDEKKIKEVYDNLKVPVRATAGSAGYDFFAPVDILLKPGETVKLPTGIRVRMEPDWVLWGT